MRPIVPLTLLLVFFGFTMQVTGQSWPRFKDYKVKIHKGRIHKPEWIHLDEGNIWRDAFGKSVGRPKINFAGKYFVTSHGCGNYCRYYTLTDLSSGLDLDIMADFSSEETIRTTSEGYLYATDVVTRANSKLLLAQFHVKSPRGEECRERAFVLEGEKLRPATNTRRSCTSY